MTELGAADHPHDTAAHVGSQLLQLLEPAGQIFIGDTPTPFPELHGPGWVCGEHLDRP